jgi:hypothetical protein
MLRRGGALALLLLSFSASAKEAGEDSAVGMIEKVCSVALTRRSSKRRQVTRR